jgi:hypothetical protein
MSAYHLQNHYQTSYSDAGVPSPPDSNAASGILPQSHQIDEHLLIPHYLSFTTPVENYHLWATRMTIALDAANLLPHVTTGLQCVLPEAEFLAWVKRDEQVRTYSIYPSLVCLIANRFPLPSFPFPISSSVLSTSGFPRPSCSFAQAKRMIMSKLGDEALDKMLKTRQKAREILLGTGKRESAFGLWVYLSCAYGGAGSG